MAVYRITCTYVYVRMYVCMYVRIYVYMYERMYVYNILQEEHNLDIYPEGHDDI